MKNYATTKINYLRTLRQASKAVTRDRVFQNSLYLMASTAVMAVFGFVFWLISARMYTAEQIGLSSTLISSATTLSLFSLLGFDNVLVRYLQGSKKPDQVIDTSLIFTSLASVVLSVAFLLALPIISPSLHTILGTPWRSFFFVVTMLLVTINTLTDSVFIAWQSAKYILIADTGLSIFKVALPVVLVSFGAFGIFAGYAVSVTVATIISLIALGKRFGYFFKPVLHQPTIREVRTFSAGTYLANLAGAVPAMVLPIMATNALGPTAAAYFNLAMTISALLFIIPRASANSLFAEGSKSSAAFGRQYTRTIRQTTLLLIPAVVGMILLGHHLLRVFGAQYVTGSYGPLELMALSAIALGFNSIATIALKVRHRLQALITIEILGTLAMLVTAWPLMKWLGVNGVALAWLVGQGIMAIMLGVIVLPILRQEASLPAPTQASKATGQTGVSL